MAIFAPLLPLARDANLEPLPVAFVCFGRDETRFLGAEKEVSHDGLARMEATSEMNDGGGGSLEKARKSSDEERVGGANPDEVGGEDEVEWPSTGECQSVFRNRAGRVAIPLELVNVVSPGVADDLDRGLQRSGKGSAEVLAKILNHFLVVEVGDDDL